MKVRGTEGTTNLLGIVFLLVGVIMIVASVCTFVGEKQFEAKAEKTTAVITEIDTYTTGSGDDRTTHHDVYVEYRVDRQVYNCMLNTYTSSMYEGKKIEVMYDPENPGDVRVSNYIAPIILVFMGLIFGGIGGGMFFANVAASGKRKKLLENGDRVTGTIINVITVTNVRINHRHPYKAEVEVSDPFTGERYLYSSKQVMDDIHYMVGSTVDVYVDRDDKSKYYVDLDSVAADDYPTDRVHDFR